MGDIGPKIGYSTKDNGYLLMTNVMIPKTNMLRRFTSVNKKGGIKQKTGLIRCEFLEYLVRLAQFKYVTSKVVETFHEATKKVIEESMKPNYKPMPW